MQELGVLIAERIAVGSWLVCSGDTRPERWERPLSGNSFKHGSDLGVCRQVVPRPGGPESVDIDHDNLIDFAHQLAKGSGGSLIRSVVFILDELSAAEPLLLTRYPRSVYAITRTLALAHAADESWTKFIVLDFARTALASIVIRTNGGIVEQPIFDRDPLRIVELMRVLTIQYCLVRISRSSSYDAANSDVYELRRAGVTIALSNSHTHFAGARKFALGLHHADGIWGTTRSALRLNAVRRIAYDVQRTTGPAFELGEKTLANIVGSRPVLFVLDRVVSTLYGDIIRQYAYRYLATHAEFVITATEAEKTWRQVECICESANAAGLSRHGLIIGVGGGIALDLAGMAASVFRRGVGYIRVPTTLVGLVDVAVGIKHGVNAFGRKNLLGSFYPPIASISDYSFLTTLPECEIACGMAEIVKVALVRDEDLLQQIEQYGEQLLASCFQLPESAAHEIALRAETLMMEELAPNLFESNLARLVDFGHTFSPKIETASNYRISHGQAVALDLLLSTAISANKGICEQSLFTRLSILLGALHLPIWHSEIPSAEELCAAVQNARQQRGGELNLVVPRAPGCAVFLQDVERGEIEKALQQMRKLDLKLSGIRDGTDRHAKFASASV
jgi:2-epi-5-epi-valiolone synthase